jgi:hypothetical protein
LRLSKRVVGLPNSFVKLVELAQLAEKLSFYQKPNKKEEIIQHIFGRKNTILIDF